MTNIRRSDLVCFLFMAITGAVLYSKTLHIPFLFDDIQNILENSTITNLAEAWRNIGAPRGLAYFSFALNYRFGGFDLSGFHITNITIHILSSWIVYLLAKRAFTNSRGAALAVGLIFLVHPIQTQAINYIVQRMTGMSAFFFLLALYGYTRAREARKENLPLYSPIHLAWYISALSAAVMALMTKQNAAVIPAALLLFDRLILSEGEIRRNWRRKLVYVLPFVMVSCLFIYLQVGKDDVLLKDAGRAEYWARADESSATAKLSSPKPASQAGELPGPRKLQKPPDNLQLIYFTTELSVLWLYLRLLFFPYNQIFDYGYPLAGKIISAQSIVAGTGLLLLLVIAFRLRRRKPLIAFGILWFFIALSVESTIIPLDAAVEHRLYLPMFGYAVAFIAILRSITARKTAAILLCLSIIGYSAASWKRNKLWSDNIAFAQDTVLKAPHNQRNYLTLATSYADAGQWAKAEDALRKAIKLRSYYHIPYDNLGSALFQQGKFAEARTYFSMAALIKPDYPNAFYNYGVVSLRLGDIAAAQRSVEKLRELRSPLAAQLAAQSLR